MATYRKAEAVVEQFNRDLAAWEQQVREKQKPAKKEQAKPPERESVLKRLRQLQAEAVTILTSIPAFRQRPTASGTSSRTGSEIAATPAK